MKTFSKNTIYLLVAAVISLAIHLFLLGVAEHIPFGNMPGLTPKKEPQRPRRIAIRSIDIRQRVLERQQLDTVQLTREVADAAAEAARRNKRLEEIFEGQDMLNPPKPKLEVKGLGENVMLPELPRLAPPAPPMAPRPEILEIDAEHLDPEIIAPDRLISANLPRKPAGSGNLPSLFHGDRFRPGSGGSLGVGMRTSLPDSLPDLESMLPEPRDDEGTNPDMTPEGALPGLPDLGDDERAHAGEQPHAIDALLDVRMVVHRLPDEPGYFRIDISPNPRSDQLRAIPKDMLFLIDRSNSISPPKLTVFKEAVQHAMQYLNPRDRFNVVSFWIKPDSLFPDYVPVNPGNLQTARKYVGGLVRGGLTDVYAGLSPYVAEDEEHLLRPLTVFIFTDGLSTVQSKLDNETFLRRIVEINRQQVSIYSASCGDEANRFLLDLLAYSNRGVPLHEPKLANFEGKIANFIRTHSDIIVANLDYSITGGMENEIYPRKLPQLYRGETLSIYGRFPKETEQLAVQITGRSADNQLLDFIFRGNVRTAPDAGQELAYDWIAQKVFALIVQNTLEPSPAIATELKSLIQKYNLQVPYF